MKTFKSENFLNLKKIKFLYRDSCLTTKLILILSFLAFSATFTLNIISLSYSPFHKYNLEQYTVKNPIPGYNTRIRNMEEIANQEDRLAAVGRLAASLAHEIRNPIASLSGAVQLLEESKENKLHKIILREVERINDLVELFLQSARSTKLQR